MKHKPLDDVVEYLLSINIELGSKIILISCERMIKGVYAKVNHDSNIRHVFINNDDDKFYWDVLVTDKSISDCNGVILNLFYAEE